MAEEREDKGFKVVDKRSMSDEERESERKAAEPVFLDLVQSLQYSAMVHLGMVQGPDGHRSPVDLPAAQDAIDMMGVLKDKTKGNLTADEDGMLTEGLYVLRMSYLAAMNAGKKP
jgi:hypothetical protein